MFSKFQAPEKKVGFLHSGEIGRFPMKVSSQTAEWPSKYTPFAKAWQG